MEKGDSHPAVLPMDPPVADSVHTSSMPPHRSILCFYPGSPPSTPLLQEYSENQELNIAQFHNFGTQARFEQRCEGGAVYVDGQHAQLEQEGSTKLTATYHNGDRCIFAWVESSLRWSSHE